MQTEMPPKAIPLSGPFFLVLLVAILISADTIQSKSSNQDAFEFIQHLKGCHKGQNTSGLHHLKQYLEKFGYLNYDSRNNKHAGDDEFDDVLESAIKSYQQHFHLKVTGTLDAATVKQMIMPRCGFPDIVNGSTTGLPPNVNKHHHNRKIIHGVSHYNFFDGSPRWPATKTHLTYCFTSGDATSAAGAANVRSACARAFQKWAQVSHFTFQEVSDNSAADIQIGFHRGEHGDGERNSFDGHGGTFAHAFQPTYGWLHFDADENWSANPGPEEVDLESVALHEIGHVLGLHHDDNVPEAVMVSYFSYGKTKRDLHADDIQGIRVLYGLNNN